jgi:hypothetical protein
MHISETRARRFAGPLALLAPFTAELALADERRLFEDSSLVLNTRHWYSHEIARKDSYFRAPDDEGGRPVRDRVAWLQGLKLDYRSGYSQGEQGLGMDFSLYGAVALERSREAVAGGSTRLLVERDGEVVDQWGKVGIAALKLKAGATEAKLGRQQIRTPVMSYADTRTLPASFDGISLQSHDLPGLTFKAGHFQRATPRTGAGSQDLSLTFSTRLVESDWIAYAGGDYRLGERGRASLYLSRFDDVWDRTYAGWAQRYRLGELDLGLRLDFYDTRSSGRENAGRIGQRAYGASVTPGYANHTLKLAFQQIDGDEYFDFPAESNAFDLPNAMLSYYNGPNERSFQVSYGTDWTPYGLPGFKSLFWYVKGWGIDGSGYDGGPRAAYNSVLGQKGESHYEVGGLLSYTVQSGPLRGVGLSTGYIWHRASAGQIEGNLEEFRLIIDAPLRLL